MSQENKLKMSNEVFREFMRISSKYSLEASQIEDLDEQEFFSILLAIYQGTKKTALQKNLSDFKLRQKNIADEKRKIFIENMQLYLLLPATVMLMVAMYPMIDMILFQLQGVF